MWLGVLSKTVGEAVFPRESHGEDAEASDTKMTSNSHLVVNLQAMHHKSLVHSPDHPAHLRAPPSHSIIQRFMDEQGTTDPDELGLL